MRLWQFVITGGPCAGKTTALSVLEQSLTQKGYKVIIVAETATELIKSGICPWEMENEQFQSILIERGINKEATTRKAATYLDRDTVIFYDRGLLDNKAYMTQEVFKKILQENGLTETEVRDEYEAVFHLVTAADGAEEAYTLANNKARTETLEQARALDGATRNAWIGHQHLRVIDNTTDFQDKIDKLLKEVYAAMGMPIPIETERKYLIKKPDEEELAKIEGITKVSIMQTYLHSSDPALERRVRQRGDGQNFTYYYTEKRAISGISRAENERRISQKEYIAFLLEGEKKIRKDRYCFIYNSQYFELDVYPDWENEAILEIELTDETQKVEIPTWIHVIKEVTDDPAYKNKNLAK
ncbi:MAG: AAA family ATPase [Clostridia bacterium]|nr:AAA family ATPase [Clostridia bacterium]